MLHRIPPVKYNNSIIHYYPEKVIIFIAETSDGFHLNNMQNRQSIAVYNGLFFVCHSEISRHSF